MLFLPLLFSISNGDALKSMLIEDGWVDMGTSQRDFGTVHSRHKPLDGLDCLEAQATTSLPLKALKEVILDIEGNVNWSSADLLVSEVLSQGNGRIDYVQVLNVPAPFSDRLWVLSGQVTTNAAGWHFVWQRIPGEGYDRVTELHSEYPDAVEISSNVGSWSLLPIENGQHVARFRSCNDAGGNIPRWAGEQTARLMLPTNIVDLFREAEKRRD